MRLLPIEFPSMTLPHTARTCPCGSGSAYSLCCGRWHAGPDHLAAPDAAALMRSRYSAFAMDLRAYLLATWHPDTRPASLPPPEPGLLWLGLEVRSSRMTGPSTAEVEFVARSRVGGGRAQRLHEVSRFVREQGRWLYVAGELR